jgi:hypothetical protein
MFGQPIPGHPTGQHAHTHIRSTASRLPRHPQGGEQGDRDNRQRHHHLE